MTRTGTENGFDFESKNGINREKNSEEQWHKQIDSPEEKRRNNEDEQWKNQWRGKEEQTVNNSEEEQCKKKVQKKQWEKRKEAQWKDQ